jgi:GT2 family glycosyltransferase
MLLCRKDRRNDFSSFPSSHRNVLPQLWAMDSRRQESGFNRGLGRNAADFNLPEPVFGACGAAVLYRRRMLDEIGFLDEDFFIR